MIFSLYKKITFDKYLLNMNTVVCKSPNKFIFLSSYIGSLVKSRRRLSGQTQRRLSGQSQRWLSGQTQRLLSSQIPMPGLWSNSSSVHLIVDHLTSKTDWFIILKFKCNFRTVLLNIPVLNDNICSYLNALGYTSSRNCKIYQCHIE